MNTRLFIALSVALSIALIAVTWQVLRESEPVYPNKRASEWLSQYSRTIGPWSSHGIWPMPTNSQWKAECETARDAIHQMGAAVLPVLLRLASTRDSSPKSRIRDFVVSHISQRQLVKLLGTSLTRWPVQDRQSAADGFKLLGPAAKSSVPALVRFLKDTDKAVAANAAMCLAGIGPEARQAVPALIDAVKDPDSQVRANAVFALGAIGPSAESAVHVLIEALDDPNSTASFYALQSLGEVRARPDLVIPALLAALAKPQEDRVIYDVAIVCLGRFGTVAQSSACLIVPFLNDEVDFIRSDATNALKQIGWGSR